MSIRLFDAQLMLTKQKSTSSMLLTDIWTKGYWYAVMRESLGKLLSCNNFLAWEVIGITICQPWQEPFNNIDSYRAYTLLVLDIDKCLANLFPITQNTAAEFYHCKNKYYGIFVPQSDKINKHRSSIKATNNKYRLLDIRC